MSLIFYEIKITESPQVETSISQWSFIQKLNLRKSGQRKGLFWRTILAAGEILWWKYF
jgi:hypothetical protein